MDWHLCTCLSFSSHIPLLMLIFWLFHPPKDQPVREHLSLVPRFCGIAYPEKKALWNVTCCRPSLFKSILAVTCCFPRPISVNSVLSVSLFFINLLSRNAMRPFQWLYQCIDVIIQCSETIFTILMVRLHFTQYIEITSSRTVLCTTSGILAHLCDHWHLHLGYLADTFIQSDLQ